jgi:zinc protease
MSMRLVSLPLCGALLSAAAPHSSTSVVQHASASMADDSLTTSYITDSIRVIHRYVPGSAVVAVNIYLLGGSTQLTPATQGIEALMIGASEAGTRTHPDTLWRQAWSGNGSTAVREFTSDWTMLGFRGLSQDFDATWRLLSERFTEPQFPTEGVEVARARLLSLMRQRRASADGEVGFVSDSIIFAGHPYALSPYGTPAVVGALDSAALHRYATTKVQRSRFVVVIVGGVTPAAMRTAVSATLAKLPIGDFVRTPPPTLTQRDQQTVTFVPRSSATNYIIGVFSGPPMTDGDFPGFDLATALLGERISEAVREKRGLSYAATATTDERSIVTGYIYVSTPSPALVLPLIKQQLNAMTNADSLNSDMFWTNSNNSLSALFQRSTSASQVEALARAELLQGNYKLADNLPRRFRSISGGTVRNAARKYIKHIQFVYAGDTTRVKREAFLAR